jgi:hypothetical protein
MAILWLLLTITVLSVFGILAVLAGADSRTGVDGDGYLGRRRHQPDGWW